MNASLQMNPERHFVTKYCSSSLIKFMEKHSSLAAVQMNFASSYKYHNIILYAFSMVWKNHSVNLLSCWAAVADSSCNLWFSSRSWATSSANSDFWRDSVFNRYSRDSSRSSNWLSLSSAGIASLVLLKKGKQISN